MKQRNSSRTTTSKKAQWKDTTRSAKPPTLATSSLRQRKQPPRECDFYDDPTILSRLILHGHYQAAINRLHEHPHEATVWVRRERTTTITETNAWEQPNDAAFLDTLVYKPHAEPQVYASYRQLPIHTACQQLLLLPRNHHVITPLLLRLISAYPAGCGYPDHTGQTPLHIVLRASSQQQGGALSGSACRRLVVVLLTAAPRVLDRIDDATTKNELRDERIQKLLEQGRHFWERVRQAAMARRNEAAATKDTNNSTVVWSEGSQHSVRLQGRATVPLATATTQDDCWVAPDELPWSQVERRCEVLEGLLAQAYLPHQQPDGGSSQEEDDGGPSVQGRPNKQQQQQEPRQALDLECLSQENQELRVLVNLYKQRILELEDMLRGREDDKDDDDGGDDTLSALTPGETKTSTSSSVYGFPVACERPTRFDSLSTLPVDLGTTPTNSASPLPGFPEDLFGDYTNEVPPRNETSRTANAATTEELPDDPSSYDTTDLDTILAEAELWNAQRLLPVMVRLWNEVEIPPPSPTTKAAGSSGNLSVASANGRARTPTFVKNWRHERHASGLILQGSRYLL